MSREKKDTFEQLLKNQLTASISQPLPEACPDENWMAAYLEGTQGEHFKKTFERHLLQCHRCQAELALLLRSEAMEVRQAVVAESSARRTLSSVLFGWTQSMALKPVFAILLVSVVTGAIGYQLLRDEQILNDRSTEMVKSTRPNSLPLADADQRATQLLEINQTAQGQKPTAGSEGLPRQAEATRNRRNSTIAPEARSIDDLRSRAKSTREERESSFAAEPPSAPVEPSGNAVGGLVRRDVATPQPLSESPGKESLSAGAMDRQNSQSEPKDEEASSRARNQVPPAALPAARMALGARPERKADQSKSADANEARVADALAKKKEAPVEGATQIAASPVAAEKDASQIDLAGKRFNLKDGVWRDASILLDDPLPTRVIVGSRDYDIHRMEFAPFEPVISRPEDVLIKLHNRVYRIQKATR